MAGAQCRLCLICCKPEASPQDSCNRPMPRHCEFNENFSQWKSVILGSVSCPCLLALQVCLQLYLWCENAQPLDTSEILTFNCSYPIPHVLTPSSKLLKKLQCMLNSSPSSHLEKLVQKEKIREYFPLLTFP